MNEDFNFSSFVLKGLGIIFLIFIIIYGLSQIKNISSKSIPESESEERKQQYTTETKVPISTNENKLKLSSLPQEVFGSFRGRCFAIRTPYFTIPAVLLTMYVTEKEITIIEEDGLLNRETEVGKIELTNEIYPAKGRINVNFYNRTLSMKYSIFGNDIYWEIEGFCGKNDASLMKDDPKNEEISLSNIEEKTNTDSVYKYFNGSINNNISLTMKLLIINTEITGTYFYDKYHIILDIRGNLSNENDFILNGYNKDTLIDVFEGKLLENNIEGKWSKPETDRELDFSLNEISESQYKTIKEE